MGFEQNGFETLFANDFDEYAAETYKYNHKKTPFIDGDVSKISEKQIFRIIGDKEVDLVVGGIPCQSFSMAGYRIRRGIDNSEDPRHFLYKEFFRILDIVKPKIAIIENVKGILSSHGGGVVKDILLSFENRGYKADYKLLDASDYNVPQARERVIIMANKIGANNIFPVKSHQKIAVGDVLKDIPKNAPNHEPRKLSGITLKRVQMIKPGQNWTNLPTELQTKSIHSGAYGRIDPAKPSRTLTTRFDTPSVGYVTHPYEDRTLTVREGARIQTFPDDFVFCGPRLKQYKQVGNAVPVQLSYAISKGVKEMLDAFYKNQL